MTSFSAGDSTIFVSVLGLRFSWVPGADGGMTGCAVGAMSIGTLALPWYDLVISSTSAIFRSASAKLNYFTLKLEAY